MGMTGVFKWFRRDMIQRDTSRQSLPPNLTGLNNDAYRTAFQAFLDRRRDPSDPGFIINSPEKARTESPSILWKKNYENTAKNNEESESTDLMTICEIPYASPSEIIEIGWLAGTEDHSIEMMYAEWQSIKVSLRRHLSNECKNAVKADIKILSAIRHPNLVLLMGTTHCGSHDIAAICEPIDCTLYHYIHEQCNPISIQGIAKNAGQLTSALKYVHMRGYIHTAISSHSIFLTSNGVMKIGAWELAIDINKMSVDVRKYEDRLRSEIFRWQAPELFSHQRATTATDVYGLTLVMWEMSTMSVPWADLNKEELEHQYIDLKRGIMTGNYNFPPLLKNLLETGLVLDANKRTLDMMKMSRFLLRLEMQYEDKKPLYVDQSFVNNRDTLNEFSYLSETSMITSNTSPFVLQSVSVSSANVPQVMSNKTPDQQKTTVEQKNPVIVREKTTAMQRRTPIVQQRAALIKQKTPLVHKKNSASIQQKTPRLKNSLALQRTPASRKKIESRKLFSDENKNLLNQSFDSSSLKSIDLLDTKNSEIYTREFRQTPVVQRRPNFISNVNESIPEEAGGDPRLDIKKIKEILANRRNTFFTTDITQMQNNPFQRYESTKSKIINQVASRDYEPHKPASHKTSIAPKLNSSVEQSKTKLTPRKGSSPRPPYSYVPPPIRSAVIQPQVLNSSSQSFFESSLWRKEKSQYTSSGQFEDSLEYRNKTSSSSSNKTFVINNSPGLSSNGNGKFTAQKFVNDQALNEIPRSSSLQALKDTLERVTDLVKASANANNSSSQSLTSPGSKGFENYGEAHDTLRTPESIFEELYKLNDNVDEEIRPIERSESAGTFTMELKKFYDGTENNCPADQQLRSKERTSPTLVEVQTALQCGIPIRSCNEYSGVIRHEIVNINGLKSNDSSSSFAEKPPVYREKNNFELFGDHLKHKKNEYTSYSEISLSRRRSLPPSLCELTINSNSNSKNESPLTKVTSKKTNDLTDETVEDIYIDDEFNENNLAPNMILSDRNSTTDSHDIYPHLADQSELI
ncbi:uncharacterized protein LOC106693063 [Microplitis demolitor]|uniref:uncharacterized protein LOC106693063 n=1 Tax=Microplitis demolitor TaxID=69319 RepID=UPI0004CD2735|nr:uncharacterized protein LOC106693063 [Microplitis demolitor]